MRIERINLYSQKLIGLMKKTGQELLETRKSPPDAKNIDRWLGDQEKIKKTAAKMKGELASMKQAQERQKAEEEGLKVLMTCLEISRRIISGDRVPPKDHEYLMKHDMELYVRSITMRRYKEDPYEYKQLSEDEKSDPLQTAMDAMASSGSANSISVPKLDEII